MNNKLPTPLEEQNKKDYLERCMSNTKAKEAYPDEKDRFGQCNMQWEEHTEKKKSEAQKGVPVPMKNQNKKDFLDRCMSNKDMKEQYQENERFKICNRQWEMSKSEASVIVDLGDGNEILK